MSQYHLNRQLDKIDFKTIEQLKFGVIVSSFNREITDKLLEGALDTLRCYDVKTADTEVVHVPGSFEIPFIAKTLAKQKRLDALICLGAVIRGETSHYEWVCKAAVQGIQRVSLEFEIPIGFGVLTCDTLEQALDRAGGKYGNKGQEAALAAIEMASLLRKMERDSSDNSRSHDNHGTSTKI